MIQRIEQAQQHFNKLPDNLEAPPALRYLMERSKFKRETPSDPNTPLELGQKRFKIETVDKPEHEDIPKIQALKAKTFRPEEVDSEEFLPNAIQGKDQWGVEKNVLYQVHTVKDENGDLLSMLAGERLDVLDKAGNPTGKQAFFIEYTITDPKVRLSGFARELYQSAVLKAYNDAKVEGKELAFAIGECTATSERFWNSLGWKRMYAGNLVGTEKGYRELPYFQAPMDYDAKTGEVAPGAAPAPEHLMMTAFGTPPTREDVAGTVESFFNYALREPRQAFESDEAFNKQTDTITGVLQTFKDQLEKGGQIVYFNAKTREEASAQGLTISEHTLADHGKAGKEDF